MNLFIPMCGSCCGRRTVSSFDLLQKWEGCICGGKDVGKHVMCWGI